MRPWRLLLAALLVLPALPAAAAESEAVRSPRAVATLVSDTDAVAPGTPFRVGLRLRLAPGWHTYWRNPGDAGVAPEVEFTLPQGVTAGPLAWPAPSRQPEDTLMTYGYTGEVLLAATISGGPGPVQATARWLVCDNICVPEEGSFTLDLPAGTPAASAEAPLFQAADARVPHPAPWPARIAADGTLVLSGPGLPEVADAWFIPETPDTIVPSATQRLDSASGRLSLALKPGTAFRADAPLSGLVVLRDRAGQDITLAIKAAPGGVPAASSPLWQLLGFAFLGGLILNLMPCVFPVLAMKAVALAALSGQQRGTARAHAATYAAGVLTTFMAIAFGLIALREAGSAAGWGFQFQSPVFVTALAVLLFAVGLNLSGVYALGGPVGAGHALCSRRGHVGSFFSGLLAVAVASPCTAPFMGVAVTAGLAGSHVTTLGVFAALGAGLATPYVLLASIPAFGRALPRPGPWMELLRQFLAFPMYAAAAWLAWVLSLQAGAQGVLALSAALVLAGFAAWALGLAQRSNFRRLGMAVAAVALLASAAAIGTVAMAQPPETAAEAGSEGFTRARLAALRAEGRPVFVNMTAAWCVTCLVNERVALGTAPVQAEFAARGVAYLKGDWTRPDPEITEFLRSNGRDGVPLYLYYPAGAQAPVKLPQLLTPDLVLSALAAQG